MVKIHSLSADSPTPQYYIFAPKQDHRTFSTEQKGNVFDYFFLMFEQLKEDNTIWIALITGILIVLFLALIITYVRKVKKVQRVEKLTIDDVKFVKKGN